ncbi:unnamed protein product [Schistosoma turkestanicum]|nr:unnamed protein product [Schistosoma turkestanicum]
MSSYQGKQRDRYEIFRIRQGMKSRNFNDKYIDLGSIPMIDGSVHTIRIYNNKETKGILRGGNSDSYYSQQTCSGDNMSNCSHQNDFGENLGPLVSYGIDDVSQKGHPEDKLHISPLPTYSKQLSDSRPVSNDRNRNFK